MNKKEIKFRDPVVERVVDKFIDRSDIGFKKIHITTRHHLVLKSSAYNHLH